VATPVVEPTVEPVVEPVAEAAPAPSGQSRRDRLLGLKPEPVVAAKPAPAPVVATPAPVRVAPSAPKVADPVVVVKKAGPKPVTAPYEGDPAMPWGYYEQIDTGATPEAAQAYVDALPTFGTVRELQDAAASLPKSSTLGEVGTPTGPVYGPPEREMERAVLPKPTKKEVEAVEAIGTGGLPLPHTNPVVALLARTLFKDQVEPVQKKFAKELMPSPETKVATAALRSDVRARAERLINDVGLRNAMGVAEDAPLEDLGIALVNASDPQYERYYRYRLSKVDALRPKGQKLADLPEDHPDRLAVKQDAMEDLATLKTVGMWGPKGLMPADRDPTSVIDAFKPTAEVIGVNEAGEPVARVQSLPSYALDAIGGSTEYAIVSTGLPAALLRGLFGDKPGEELPTYDYGQIAGITVPMSPESIRARRDYFGAKSEADVEGTGRRLLRSAGETVGAPDAVTDAAEYVGGKSLNFNVGASAFVASLLTPGPLELLVYGAKAAGAPIGVSKEEKLLRAEKDVSTVAVDADKKAAYFGDLIAKGATEDEVVEALRKAADEAEQMTKPLTQSAKDAIADAARVRTQAERAAVEAAQPAAAAKRASGGVLYAEGGGAPVRRTPGDQTDTPAFKRFIEGTKAVDEEGAPKRLYHGTTHEFDAFNPTLANVENHHGRGIYLTSSAEDVGANYATRQGADIKSRIESRHEEMVDVWDDPDEASSLVDEWAAAHPERKADADVLRAAVGDPESVSAGPRLLDEVTRWKAEQQIAGQHGGAVLPLYAAIKKPVDLRPGKVTRFDIETKWSEDGEDFLGEEGLGVQAKEAIQRVARDYDDDNLADEVLSVLDDPDGFTAADLEQAVRRVGSDWYADGERSSPGQFLQDVYREMGFDGIVISADKEFGAGRKFGQRMPGINPDTEHWVAFEPTQVKSATGNVGTWNPKDPRHLYQTVTVRKGEETLAKFGLPPRKKKYTTREVAAALEARQRKKYGLIDAKDQSPAARRKIAKWMAEEVAFEKAQAGRSGAGWYSEKYQRAIDTMAEEFPELASDPEARMIFTALVAVTSDGNKVMPNMKMAADIYDNFRKTGKFSTPIGHVRQSSIDKSLAVIQELHDEGGAPAFKRLLDEITVGQYNKQARATKRKEIAGELVSARIPTAASLFGPKLGAFYANLMGAEGYLTMDRWWSRTFNRYRGTLLERPTREGLDRMKVLLGDPAMTDDAVLSATVPLRKSYEAKGFKEGTEAEVAANTVWKAAFDELADAPTGGADRKFMREAAMEAQAILKKQGMPTSLADIQAILWYYEKRLYGELGARETADIAFDEAARRVVAERRGRAGSSGRPLGPDGEAAGVDVAEGVGEVRPFDPGDDLFEVAEGALPIKVGYRGKTIGEAEDAIETTFATRAEAEAAVREGGPLEGFEIWSDWAPKPGRANTVLADVATAAAESGDEAVAAVAKHLAETRGDDLAAVVVRTDVALPGSAVGRYDPGVEVIDLATNATAKTMVHEAAHVITHNALTNPHLYSPAVQRAVRNLGQLHELVRRIPGIEDMGRIYGLKNTDEFVAEALSSPEFQALLREVKVTVKDGEIVLGTGGESSRSLWDSFVATMAKILGFSDTDALGHVLSNTQTIIREGGGSATVIRASDTSPWATRVRDAAMAVQAKSPTTDFAWLVEHPKVGGAQKEVEAYKAALTEAGMDPRVVPEIEGVVGRRAADALYARQKGSGPTPFRGAGGKPRTATMFSGGGLVEVGLRGQVDPVFAVEANADIGAHYKAAHGGHVRIDDVRNVDIGEAGDVDYLHASPVCKNFSAAKVVTEDGEQPLDLLTAQATADAIRKTKPRVFTLENVKGYQNSEAMRLVEDALREEGYTFDALVYDAADFGAPTSRKRLLLRAVKGGTLPPPPVPTHGSRGAQPHVDWYGTVADLVDDLPDATPVPPWARERLKARGIDPDRVEKPLLVMGGSAGSTTVPHAFAGGAAPTIKATPGELHRIILPDGRVKRVTPQVLARLTGLPDDYPLPTNAALATTIIGNGVPPALSKAVFGSLLDDAAQVAQKSDDFLYAPPARVKSPGSVQYSATPMKGTLEGAEKAEQKARAERASSQFAALGFAEGLRRVAALATSTGPNAAKLTPAEAAAYAERLFDSAATTARELALGAQEAIAPAASQGAVRALVEAVGSTPPTPATKALVDAAAAADAARRMFTGERLAKALKAVTPRLEKAVREVMNGGIAVTPAQRAAFRDAAVLQLEGTLVGKGTLARAEAAVDKVLATAPVDQITPQMMGDVDALMRTYATEAAEATRRVSPLRSAAPSILLGESASRFRGVKANPTLLRDLKNGAVRAVKLVFMGGNEMAPWAKEGLSKEAREWTLAAERRLDAIAGDVGKMESLDEAADFLRGKPGGAGKGLLTTGMDRFDVFTNLVNVQKADVDQYLDALLSTDMQAKSTLESLTGAGIAGRPEQDGAKLPFWKAFESTLEAARAGKIDAAEFMERLHTTAKRFTRDGEVPEAWTRITTGWIAAQAENVVLLNKGFGDGIVFTKQDADAIRALAGGRFDEETIRALSPATMVERAVASNRMVGAGALDAPKIESIGGKDVQVGGKVGVPGARQDARAAERIGLYNAVMTEQIYVPRMVRERMTGAIARTFTPQTYGGNNMLSVWKLANTRGVLASKPGYMLNNMPGDTEQIMIAVGMKQALKTAVRAEGSSVVAILRSAIPSVAGHVARAVIGDAVAPVVRSVVQGGVDFGLGVFLAYAAGKNKGAIAKLIHAGGAVGETLAGKVSNMLGMGAMRVEISTIMDGGDELVTIGDRVWKASELRRTAIETGVYDSFDRAELVQSVNGLSKLFRVPAEGVSSIAETVSLRKRLALYTVLIEEGMQPAQAGRATVEALFDYRAILSEGEQHWLRQVLLPFWSWQKSMNRLVINSVASPMGAYRLRVTHQVGEKAQEMAAEAPTTEGDDVGILNTFMLADEVKHYDRFRRFRALAEAVNPDLTPENWNAILLRSNPTVPVTMEWAKDPTIPKEAWLEPDDVDIIRAYLSPWYSEQMARSYLRDRTQVRMKHPVTTEGKVVPTETWHAVAPHSGLAGSMEWFSMVTAGSLAAGAIGLKTLGVSGDWLSMNTPGEALAPMLDPRSSPTLGSLIASMDPAGRSPQRVAQSIPKTADAVRDAIAGFMVRSGVADGDWRDATPGVKIDDKSGTVVYTFRPEVAALIGSFPGIADLNRQALTYEGSKGEAYAPDVARILLQSLGFSTPTVENMAGLKEVGERTAWVKAQLPQYGISRGAEGERLITSGDAPE
jgi:DNA (cytosine-5)-methyltransferase 1